MCSTMVNNNYVSPFKDKKILSLYHNSKMNLTKVANELIKNKIYSNEIKTLEIAKYAAKKYCSFTDEELDLLDIYWDPAFNKSWLYVSDEMVENMFGYKKSKDMMRTFATKLKEDFEDSIDYQIVDKLHDLVKKFYSGCNPSKESRGGALKKYYIITGETFKSLLMMSKTEKGKQTRKLYIKIENLAITSTQIITQCVILMSSDQLKTLQDKNNEKDLLLESKEDQLNRLHNIQKELLSYKKRVSKEETIYIVSTANYARQGIFKIGRTKTQMKFRSSGHNTTHIKGDKVKVLREFKVNDCVLVEKNIHTKLNGLLLEGEKEFFMCPYDLLESIVDLIVNNDDEENDMVNKIVETVYKLKQNAFNAIEWSQGIPEDIFKEKLLITNGEEKIAELDITQWSETHKKEFIANCLGEYVKQQNKIDKEYTLMWKAFQEFLFKQLSIPRSKFKSTEWKPFVKEEIGKKDKLSIKWRAT